MDRWEVLKREVTFEHPFARMVVDTLERDGETRPYYIIESPADAVAVVAVTGDSKLVLTRQYRHPVGEIIYDLPGGRAEPDEAPIESAWRELQEETGYRANHIEPLGSLNPFPGSIRITMHLFFAKDLEAGYQKLDPGEELEVQLMSFEEVYQQVVSDTHIDVALQMGTLLARARGLA